MILGDPALVRALLAAGVDRLAAAGVPSPRPDAEALLAHVLGVERSALALHRHIDGDDAGAYEVLLARRAEREPLQHILGRVTFRYVDLAVGPGVFIPRPETEVVAGAAIDAAIDIARSGRRPVVVVDLCTGSGAIAASVAHELAAADVASQVIAVEVDPAACAWARRNLAGHGVELVEADIDGCLSDRDGRVDVVVANPPYIPVEGVVRDPEVADHDPPVALWSGADGLDAMRVVERTAARLLRPGGVVFAEHADLQGEAVPALFRSYDAWRDVADHSDLSGRPRFVTARRTDLTLGG